MGLAGVGVGVGVAGVGVGGRGVSSQNNQQVALMLSLREITEGRINAVDKWSLFLQRIKEIRLHNFQAAIKLTCSGIIA